MARSLPAFLCVALALLTGAGPAQDPGGKKAPAKASTKSEVDPPLPDGSKVWISPDTYKNLYKDLQDRYKKAVERAEELERQLARGLPSACKLTGKLEGDALVLGAEFRFTTQLQNTSVFLGLKNGFLTDEGVLDDGLPHLEATDDGFVVRVEKEGAHRLTLNLKVAVAGKRASSSGNERAADLGLPGAAVTTLSLSLPTTVRDFRWNDNVAIPRTPGQYEVTIGAQKALALMWKEPVTGAVQGLAPSARANVDVKLDEGRLEISGKIVLEDPRLQMREWQLLLPASVKLNAAAGTPPFTVTSPDGKSNYYMLRLSEPTEKTTLTFQGQYARTQAPLQRVPIGPFLVQGANVQSTILVQAVPGVLRGQRLLYHRFGESFQHDPPKNTAAVENLALFQVFNAPFSGKGLSPNRAALEIEWKTDKGQIEASAEHDVRFLRDGPDWIVEVETRFVLHSPSSGQDSVDLLTPVPVWSELMRLATQPAATFPATLRWTEALSPRLPIPIPGAIVPREGVRDLEGPLPDVPPRWRVKLARAIDREIDFRIQSRSVLSGQATRFLVSLPRLAGVLDRGGKITVAAPPTQEFLVGPVGQEEQPVREKFQQSLDQMPQGIELAWRPGGRERLAQALADVVLRDHSVRVRQRLTLAADDWSDRELDTRQIPLLAPSSEMVLAPGVGRIERGRVWLPRPAANAAGKIELDLTFDLPIDRLAREGRAALRVPLLWPEGTTRREAKVRVWSEPSLSPSIVGLGKTWIENDVESVPGMRSYPALVATGLGDNLQLSIQLDEAGGGRLPAFACHRTLVQARLGEDGNQSIQLRFLVKRFGGSAVEIDLPAPWEQAQPVVRIGGKEVGGVQVVDRVRNRIRVPLAPQLYPQPVLFEVAYQTPAELVDGKRAWLTPLALPKFAGEVFFGPTRYLVTLPAGQVPFVLGTADVDYRWSLQGSLFGPEPSVSNAELDTWIGETDSGDRRAISLAWWRSGLEPQRIYHVSRQSWLMVCSGAVLLLGLVLLLVALPRWALGLVLLGLGITVIALGIAHDYLLPLALFGAQPALAVLILISAFQWLVHERYRRQLIFMPTFTRVPTGSTIVRGTNKPRELSTIDAPPGFINPASARGSAP